MVRWRSGPVGMNSIDTAGMALADAERDILAIESNRDFWRLNPNDPDDDETGDYGFVGRAYVSGQPSTMVSITNAGRGIVVIST